MAQPAGSNEATVAAGGREARRGPRLPAWLRFSSRPPDDDSYVRQWKQAWATGAKARWRGAGAGENPHRGGSSRATAWAAGWAWADQQPDRRTTGLVRFAVPQRRASDRMSPLLRSTRAGAVGLSVLAVAGWLWQARRRG